MSGIDLKVFHASAPVQADPGPGITHAIQEVFAKARASAFDATVIMAPSGPDERRALSKRRHDLKAALRTLGFTVKALESGYTFQDDKAAAKIDAISKAVAVLEKEADILANILST